MSYSWRPRPRPRPTRAFAARRRRSRASRRPRPVDRVLSLVAVRIVAIEGEASAPRRAWRIAPRALASPLRPRPDALACVCPRASRHVSRFGGDAGGDAAGSARRGGARLEPPRALRRISRACWLVGCPGVGRLERVGGARGRSRCRGRASRATRRALFDRALRARRRVRAARRARVDARC